MKQRKWKRKMIGGLILLLIVSLIGCSKEAKPEDKKSNMGRYMEETITLPKEFEEGYSSITQNEKGQIELYSKSLENGKIIVKKHTLQEDGTFLSEEAVWLTKHPLTEESNTFQVVYGEDGNLYAGMELFGKKGYNYAVVKASKDLKEGEMLSISYLKKPHKDRDDQMPLIRDLGVLADGSYVMEDLLADGILILSSETGEVIGQVASGKTENMHQPFYIKEDQIITGNADKSGVTIYNTGTQEKEKSVEYKLKAYGYAFNLQKEGEIYLVDSDGIHKKKKDGSIWETIVDGSLNSLSLPNRQVDRLIVRQGESEEYYTFGNNGEGITEMQHYYYDAKVTAVPEKEITIYSLTENPTVRQATVTFQKKNTNVKVNYHVAMGEQGGNISDYIKTLNTELLAGAGADILVLDGLPIDAYTEKGVLEEISDVLKQLEEKGGVLENIREVYQKDDKQYGMPLRFGVPLLVGEKEALKAMHSLNSTADYAKSLGNNSIWKEISYRNLTQIFMATEWKHLINGNKVMQEKELVQFLKDLEIVAKNVKASENGFQGGRTMRASEIMVDNALLFSIPLYNNLIMAKNKLAMEYTTDLYTAALPIAAAAQKKLELSSYADVFVPQGIVGLNKAGKNMELSKEFYAYLFSDEVQETILYDGYPVNKNAFSKWMESEDEGYRFGMSGESGVEFTAAWPTKKERIELKKIIESLKIPIENDRILSDSIVEGALSFLKGEKSAEDAAASIKSKVDMYLAE